MYILIFTSLDSRRNDKMLYWMAESIPRIEFALHSVMNAILIC
jgi:hypothetical protein